MRVIEKVLDRYTMYQVLLAVLVSYVLIAVGFSLAGFIFYSVTDIVLSVLVLLASSLVTHYVLVAKTKAPANVFSSIITALILFLIFTPTSDLDGLGTLALIGVVSVLGKYIIRYRNVHLINPVALTAVLFALTGLAYASWWVGSVYLNLFVLIGGILVTLKIRRMPMVIAGILASVLMAVVFAVLRGDSGDAFLTSLLFASPLWFFMTIMVTEPLSTPAGRGMQIFYGGFIGALSQIPFAFGPFFNSPELTLVIANLLLWPLSLRGRLTLTLKSVKDVAQNTREYIFKPSFRVVFRPGQYLEWALPHQSPDWRGSRRYFTIASSPLKKTVRLVVRHSEAGSTYKENLEQLKSGAVLHAAQLAGDFILPENVTNHKYVFVAGGIGVTPFVSMVEDCLIKHQAIDAHLLYCNNEIDDIAYADLFSKAQNIGLQTTHVLNRPPTDWRGESGFLTQVMIQRLVPDLQSRIIYLSGPPGMVNSYEKLFEQLGVPRSNIKTDYFPGLA